MRAGIVHIDASYLVRALVRDSREDASLREWIAADRPIVMSTIAWTEFLCGPVDEAALALASQVIARRAQFTQDMAVIAAELFNGLGRRRGTFIDCMIAAAAFADDADIAAGNPDDFTCFEEFGLTVDRGIRPRSRPVFARPPPKDPK